VKLKLVDTKFLEQDTRHQTRLDQCREVLRFLNDRAEKRFRDTHTNLKLIAARLDEGYSVADMKQVIALKVREWKGDDVMDQYLRPATLFRATNFNNYYGNLK
jgi:uncharacterized phage protein (TIGR02220 family)